MAWHVIGFVCVATFAASFLYALAQHLVEATRFEELWAIAIMRLRGARRVVEEDATGRIYRGWRITKDSGTVTYWNRSNLQ